jgi:hypothetical protein
VEYGETLNFGLDKQIERVVEVLALSALLRADPAAEIIVGGKWVSVEKQLQGFAFPLDIDLDEEDYNKVPKWAKTSRCKELFKNDL